MNKCLIAVIHHIYPDPTLDLPFTSCDLRQVVGLLWASVSFIYQMEILVVSMAEVCLVRGLSEFMYGKPLELQLVR